MKQHLPESHENLRPLLLSALAKQTHRHTHGHTHTHTDTHRHLHTRSFLPSGHWWGSGRPLNAPFPFFFKYFFPLIFSLSLSTFPLGFPLFSLISICFDFFFANCHKSTRWFCVERNYFAEQKKNAKLLKVYSGFCFVGFILFFLAIGFGVVG